MVKFSLKRAYDPVERTDGYRVLVDRLWPRGISKDKIKLDEWAKDIAPSNELRKWLLVNKASRFSDFAKRYKIELCDNPEFKETLARWYKQDKVTLVYGAKDRDRNEAVVLLDILDRK